MERRRCLGAAAASPGAPGLVRAEPDRVLRFIPQSDVTAVDPAWTSAHVTRDHGYRCMAPCMARTAGSGCSRR
jgi:peptide/nickel transport system substrate-binding protein